MPDPLTKTTRYLLCIHVSESEVFKLLALMWSTSTTLHYCIIAVSQVGSARFIFEDKFGDLCVFLPPFHPEKYAISTSVAFTKGLIHSVERKRSTTRFFRQLHNCITLHVLYWIECTRCKTFFVKLSNVFARAINILSFSRMIWSRARCRCSV